MQVDLPTYSYDHEDGVRKSLGGNEKMVVLSPYGQSAGGYYTVFAVAILYTGDSLVLDGSSKSRIIKVRFPLGVVKRMADLTMFNEGLLKTKFIVVRMFRKVEYVCLYPEFMDGAIAPLYPTGKKTKHYDARKFCQDIHLFSMEESLSCRVLVGVYTLIPEHLSIWKPMYFKKIESRPLIAMKLAVELQMLDRKGYTPEGALLPAANSHFTPVKSTVQIPLGWMKGKAGNLQDDMREALKVISMANPKVSVGAVHGISLHVQLNGEISKTIRFYLKNRSHIVMSLADTCPTINFVMCTGDVKISGVKACATPVNPASAILVNSAIEELEEGIGPMQKKSE